MKISNKELLKIAKLQHSYCIKILKELPKNKKWYIKFNNEEDFINYGLPALKYTNRAKHEIENWKRGWKNYYMHFDNNKYTNGYGNIQSCYIKADISKLKYTILREYTKNLIVKLNSEKL